ncbi:hypothetical protein Q4E93_21955 [Flavitalea sp. BT771]|uniref:hypothetical protein n=1 Tax=Flavitalea sp. BT771 TaxID=3063329 RepID=UPI0026E31D25|nr:hypothetical protein [Flavitalea sp. BT771]MDO6433291.1 hypothetical protein [Flavitalea sp. BT771]MDV6222804.1 hypothetical protein [Flavitalea sp. BT771]
MKPTTPTAFFIEKGHIMEVLDIGVPGKVIIPLFFGPGEFAVRCHPRSNLKGLDKVSGNTFTHTMIIQTLRKFPESHVYYREMRRLYHEKVQDRLRSLQTMSDQERYDHLKATQPWVLKLAEPGDIAAYLGVSKEVLRELRK